MANRKPAAYLNEVVERFARKFNYQVVGTRGRNLRDLREMEWLFKREPTRRASLRLRAEQQDGVWRGLVELWYVEPGMVFLEIETQKLLVDPLEKLDGTQCWAATKKRFAHWATHI